jgi:hypothetical protein
MARIGFLDGVHRQGTNGVGKLAASWHFEGLLVEGRAVIVPDALLASNIGTQVPFSRNRVHTIAVCLCIAGESAAMTQFTVEH